MSKLSELILYIASQSQDDPTFGQVKLNHLLFAIDFVAYGIWGHPITTTTYIRQESGAVPTQFASERETLLSAQRATIQTRIHLGKEQKRLVALDMPDMSLFSEAERTLIDDTIREFKSLNTTQLNDWIQSIVPLLDAEDREEIPFHTVFIFRQRPVSQTGLQWAEKRLKELRESGDVP